MFSKKRLLLTIFFYFLISLAVFSQSNIYAVLSNINTTSEQSVLVYDINNEIRQADRGDTIEINETLITYENQQAELVIYEDLKPIAYLIIDQNSDLSFALDQGKIVLNFNYGKIRIVVQPENRFEARLTNLTVNITGTDFGLFATLNDSNLYEGNLIVFNGQIKAYSHTNPDKKVTINQWYYSHYLQNNIEQQQRFSAQQLQQWQNSMQKISQSVPEQLNLVLENLEFLTEEIPPVIDQPIEVEPEVAEPIDETTDQVIMEEQTSDQIEPPQKNYRQAALNFVASLLQHEIGTINYGNDFAIRVVSRPGIKILDDKFEFGFYLPLNLIPSKAFTKDGLLDINQSNNEWSFGSDQNREAKKVVFDIFDDILLKLRIIRFNDEEDKFFIQAGDYYDVSDINRFSMLHFNTK
ncbi:MAG: hypothetical protein MJB14_23480, partial [Spirochaetes bacterium]|nr:hypothetical protein [Spirochaetota bacterium]